MNQHQYIILTNVQSFYIQVHSVLYTSKDFDKCIMSFVMVVTNELTITAS